jgi:hypothetical protein
VRAMTIIVDIATKTHSEYILQPEMCVTCLQWCWMFSVLLTEAITDWPRGTAKVQYLIMSSINTKTCDTIIYNYNYNQPHDKINIQFKIFVKFSFFMWSQMYDLKPRRCLILHRIRQYFGGDIT